MGREIRRVPPNWEHPRYTSENARRQADIGQHMPLYDQTYDDARQKWLDGFALWQQGKHPEQIKHPGKSWTACDWWEYDSPPDREMYRPAFTEPATWFQVYQTVSEGSPVTPPFATREELIQHLVDYGEEWGRGGYSREQAEAFVNAGSAPSMVITGGKTYIGIESAAL